MTGSRAASEWLRAGSQTVQQQALRDFDQAVTNFYRGSHRRPSWREAGVHKGFRIVGPQAQRVQKLNRKWARVLVPKVGWVRFRLSKPLVDAKSYRVTRDRAGRRHIAFAVIPDPIPGPGTGDVVGIDRGVTVSAALSTGARLKAREADRRKDWVEQTSTDLARRFDLIRVEDLDIAQLTRSAKGTADDPGTRVRQKAGLNRGILANGWGQLVQRLEDKAAGRVGKVPAAYTSQRCSRCGVVDREARESQAVFRCRACEYAANADVNAAVDIAAGRAVTARGATAVLVAEKREPQLPTSA